MNKLWEALVELFETHKWMIFVVILATILHALVYWGFGLVTTGAETLTRGLLLSCLAFSFVVSAVFLAILRGGIAIFDRYDLRMGDLCEFLFNLVGMAISLAGIGSITALGAYLLGWTMLIGKLGIVVSSFTYFSVLLGICQGDRASYNTLKF